MELTTQALDALYGFIEEVHEITESDVLEAKNILLSYSGCLQARDALHAAHMNRLEIKTVLSFDKGFDLFPYLTRIPQPDYPEAA